MKRQQQTSAAYRSLSSPRSDGGRDLSPDRHPIIQYYNPPENTRSRYSRSPHTTRRSTNKPEYHVYGNRTVQDREPNWIIAQKPREHRYTQRRDIYRESNSHSYPNHVRSRSADPFQKHYVVTGRDTVTSQGRPSRYVRNRSQSPHRGTITRVKNEDNVIRAIQMGLEKRNRAIRHSLRQMADPADYEWEI